jgi:hypothetical protein
MKKTRGQKSRATVPLNLIVERMCKGPLFELSAGPRHTGPVQSYSSMILIVHSTFESRVSPHIRFEANIANLEENIFK